MGSMKLCIVKVDGTSVEVLVNERQPSLDMLDNELLLFENYRYKIIIRDNEINNNIELFLGDYPVSIHYNEVTDCYESELELIFEGCYDLASFTIFVDRGDEERVYYTNYLRVATTKQTAKQVEGMLSEIEDKLPNFLEICFSRNYKKSGIKKNEVRSIWNTLKIVDEIIEVYEDNYGYFSNYKKSFVENTAAIVDAKDMRVINQTSLNWIASNPDYLIQTETSTGIVIDGKNYMPSKVKTYLPNYSYEVYENRIILGFLKTILLYIENQIIEFNKEMTELANIPDAVVAQLPNTHELTGRCIYIYYKGIIKRFEEKEDLLREIYYRYENVLQCTAENIYGTPKLTNTFKKIYHYRMCYECMVKWFEAGDYTFEHLNYLFKIKTLSRIFEYYCLIKIQNALVQSGYILRDAQRVIYNMEDEAEDINNQYIFSGNGCDITLLYEPTIWVNKVNDGMNLYSTGYNFSKNRWNNKWTPDFVLKLLTENGEYYYILDAKYSNAVNVKKRHITQLVLKYGTQIASKDKFFSDIIGVGAIYPSSEDEIYYFKRNSVGSQKCSLPQYFSLAILDGSEGDLILRRRLEELLNVVETIETGSVNATLLDVNQIAKVEMKNNSRNTLQKKLRQKDMSAINTKKANGKKCFYNAKGMCLYQKKRCNIIDDSCSYFVAKKSRNLLTDEDSCRNMISYVKREKVQRIECSITGLPGCIGPDDCKFCLQKSKNKR